MKTGALPRQNPTLSREGISVYGGTAADNPEKALTRFVEPAQAGDYIAIQAFLRPTSATTRTLQEFRTALRSRTGLATMFGYGPRYLHSTGQLHKGDGGNGLFIMFTADDPEDAPIPDEAGKAESSITFGVLKEAQAQGDLIALQNTGRRVIRFHLGDDISGGLHRLLNEVG